MIKSLGFVVLVLGFFSCNSESLKDQLSSTELSRDSGTDSSILQQKISLGKQLFFDARLSLDGSISCASCHNPSLAFCDNLPTSIGIHQGKNARNAPSILNARYLKNSMFDANIPTLEMQALIPLQEKTEMGHDLKNLIPILRSIPEYQNQAKKVFNRAFDAYVLTRSLGAFERSLLSMNSPYDRFMAGETKALTKSQQLGMVLFENKLQCATCHPPPHFTNHNAENNGFTAYIQEDPGRFRVSNDSSDIGKFKVPSLRNVALTFPYMHNGKLKTLDDVVDHYSSGGKQHPNKSSVIQPFHLSKEEKKQLVSFLQALTDTSYLQQYSLYETK